MKAEQLRIGNYVSRKFFNPNPKNPAYEYENCIVKGIGFEKINVTTGLIRNEILKLNYESLKPIPLTEEWLLKFGFVNRYSNVWMKEDNERENVFEFDDNNLYFTAEEGVNYSVAINNIHGLQNFYFALTGTELTINK